MTITHTLPNALIASFASPAEQAQWLAANPTHQLLGRIIRPQSAPGETFAVLVNHATIAECVQAQVAEARALQKARLDYATALKAPERRADLARRRFARKWGANDNI